MFGCQVCMKITYHSLGHPWLISRRLLGFLLLVFFHGLLDLFGGDSRLDGQRVLAFDVFVVNNLKDSALLQGLDDGSVRLVFAHPGEAADALERDWLVLLAASLVEKVFVMDKILI
jgi:hypothetical protein